jgi:hypothetical protein
MKENEQPQQTQGKLYRWVRASERTPDIFDSAEKHYNLDGKKVDGFFLHQRCFEYFCNEIAGYKTIDESQFNRIEWLEEYTEQFNQPTQNEFTPPYRVGRKQKRAILDSNGLEVGVFKTGSESEAQRYCDYLNQQPAQVLSDSGIEELWDKYSEYIDDDIDSLQRIAGQSVVTRNSFIKSIQSLKGNGFSLGDVRKSISFGMEIQEGKHGNILIEDWINSLHSFPHT